MVLSIALIAFLTYRDILGYFFTGIDTMALIDSGRIQSFGDVIRIFNEPLGSNTPMLERVQKCYRPISTLSYSLDYSIWKLNPFGYHLTNLILHILVSILVFFFIRFLTSGKQVTALLGALIFTTHPVLVEGIPATIRRFDTITTLFVLLSILLFLKYFSTAFRKRGYLLFSIFFYILALGAKEIAVILPFLIFTYLITISFSDEEPFKDRIFQSVKICLPYFILTFIYLAWRTYILQGIGGYVKEASGAANISQLLIEIGINYFIVLPYPVDFLRLNSLFSPFSGAFKQIGFLVALSGFFIFLLFYKQAIFKIINNNKGIIKTLKILLAAVVILSLITILVYPLVSPYINHSIQQAYDGKGLKFLTDEMEDRDSYPVEFYFYRARDLILRLSLISLFFSTICLIGIHRSDAIKRQLISSANGKLIAFLLIWMILPLGIYLIAQISGRYYLYIAVVPFSAILSIMLVESFQTAIQKIRENSSSCLSFFNSKVLSFIMVAGLSISLLAYSPLVRTYGGWKDSGDIQQMFLNKLLEILPELPDDAVLHIYNFPNGISSYEAKIPHAREVTYLNYYNIESWLNLNYPSNRMDVVIHSKTKLAVPPNNLDLELTHGKDNNVVINVIYDSSKGTQHRSFKTLKLMQKK